MRKIILLLLMTISLFTAECMADAMPGMIVTMSSGNVKEYVISNIEKITYVDGNMVLTVSGSDETLSTDDIAKITLSGIAPTDIEGVAAKCKEPLPYSLFTLDGQSLGTGSTSDVQSLMGSLPAGKYILNLNGKTIKVVK